eukprot:g27165.t1
MVDPHHRKTQVMSPSEKRDLDLMLKFQGRPGRSFEAAKARKGHRKEKKEAAASEAAASPEVDDSFQQMANQLSVVELEAMIMETGAKAKKARKPRRKKKAKETPEDSAEVLDAKASTAAEMPKVVEADHEEEAPKVEATEADDEAPNQVEEVEEEVVPKVSDEVNTPSTASPNVTLGHSGACSEEEPMLEVPSRKLRRRRRKALKEQALREQEEAEAARQEAEKKAAEQKPELQETVSEDAQDHEDASNDTTIAEDEPSDARDATDDTSSLDAKDLAGFSRFRTEASWRGIVLASQETKVAEEEVKVSSAEQSDPMLQGQVCQEPLAGSATEAMRAIGSRRRAPGLISLTPTTSAPRGADGHHPAVARSGIEEPLKMPCGAKCHDVPHSPCIQVATYLVCRTSTSGWRYLATSSVAEGGKGSGMPGASSGDKKREKSGLGYEPFFPATVLEAQKYSPHFLVRESQRQGQGRKQAEGEGCSPWSGALRALRAEGKCPKVRTRGAAKAADLRPEDDPRDDRAEPEKPAETPKTPMPAMEVEPERESRAVPVLGGGESLLLESKAEEGEEALDAEAKDEGSRLQATCRPCDSCASGKASFSALPWRPSRTELQLLSGSSVRILAGAWQMGLLIDVCSFRDPDCKAQTGTAAADGLPEADLEPSSERLLVELVEARSHLAPEVSSAEITDDTLPLRWRGSRPCQLKVNQSRAEDLEVWQAAHLAVDGKEEHYILRLDGPSRLSDVYVFPGSSERAKRLHPLIDYEVDAYDDAQGQFVAVLGDTAEGHQHGEAMLERLAQSSHLLRLRLRQRIQCANFLIELEAMCSGSSELAVARAVSTPRLTWSVCHAGVFLAAPRCAAPALEAQHPGDFAAFSGRLGLRSWVPDWLLLHWAYLCPIMGNADNNEDNSQPDSPGGSGGSRLPLQLGRLPSDRLERVHQAMEELKEAGLTDIKDLAILAQSVKKGQAAGNAKDPTEQHTSESRRINAAWRGESTRRGTHGLGTGLRSAVRPPLLASHASFLTSPAMAGPEEYMGMTQWAWTPKRWFQSIEATGEPKGTKSEDLPREVEGDQLPAVPDSVVALCNKRSASSQFFKDWYQLMQVAEAEIRSMANMEKEVKTRGDGPGVLFSQSRTGRYVPRSIFAGSQKSMDTVSQAGMFDPLSIVVAPEGQLD